MLRKAMPMKEVSKQAGKAGAAIKSQAHTQVEKKKQKQSDVQTCKYGSLRNQL